MLVIAIDSAVEALGLVKPHAAKTIAEMMTFDLVEHPCLTTTRYRKEGEQLTKEEKKALSLRSNAFLSRAAYDDLTEAGLMRPLEAHELVMLRAYFIMARYRTVRNTAKEMAEVSAWKGDFKYDILNKECPVCWSLEGQHTKANDAYIMPPPGCVCETANYGFGVCVDWLADIE
ncbi:hypothetical protein [Sphingobium sp. HWE2-09]|uniref:hypothetical protein n=1 Tax=Sphingobium sp. HWE2-09 TaxID=3108390 RepID=UPI002DC274C4|nr:hypothetical protein [Sphingobium sp. HWE2-09]